MAKPTIVTRATKGSALTWTEGDANFTNLQNATLTVKAGTAGTSVVSDLNSTITLVAGTNVTLSGDNTAKTVTINATGGFTFEDDTAPTLGGDLNVNTHAITAAADGDVNVAVTGSGTINLSHGDPDLDGGRVIVGDGVNAGVIVSNGATDLILGANDGAATISVSSDGKVFLTPDTGSSVDIQTSVTRLGTSSAAATLTTNGAYNLTISTNNGTVTNVPTITLTSGGGIALQATAGTGPTNAVSVINSVFLHNMNSSVGGSGAFFQQAHTTADANNFGLGRARGTTLSLSAVQTGDELAEFVVAGHDGQTGVAGYEQAWGFTTTVIDTPSSNIMPVRTDFVINTGASTLSTYHSIAPDLVFRVAELGTVSGVTDLFISGGTNGSVEIAPDGTGQIRLFHGDPDTGSAVIVGDGTHTAAIGSNDATSMVLLCDPGNASGQAAVYLDATTGNAEMSVGPQSGAKIVLGGPTTQVGNGSSAATITTQGAYNLNINTNNGTNTGSSVVVGQGTNSTLQLNASGTGSVVLNGTNNATGVVVSRRSQTTTSTGVNVMAVQRNYTLSTLSGMDGHFAGLAFSQRDSAGTQAFYARVAGVYSTTASNHSFTFDISNNGFTNTIRQAELGPNFFALGDVTGTADQYLTTNGAKSLVLITEKGGGGEANIKINAGTDADIELTPDGAGAVVVNGLFQLPAIPAADITGVTGVAGQMICVSDSAGGGHPNGMLAFWDTTNSRWSYVHDNSAV